MSSVATALESSYFVVEEVLGSVDSESFRELTESRDTNEGRR